MSTDNQSKFPSVGRLVDDDALEEYFQRSGAEGGAILIGFGSLMSKVSSSGTFPNLRNFQTVRIDGYRRVFRHPASIFFEREVADLANLRFSSLCCEKAPGHSFLAVTFCVDGETSDAYLKREEEFSFDLASFTAVDGAAAPNPAGAGLICVDSSDDVYIRRWGRDAYEKKYLGNGLKGIWCYDENSGIEPCWVYLRHCYLSAQNLGPAVLNSFLDDTFLADRTTSIRQYLDLHPDVLNTLPPENLIGRYSG